MSTKNVQKEVLMDLLITLLIASFGGFLATRFKFPGGALIGALITVSIYHMTTSQAVMPLEIRIFTQIISGIFIGSSINRSDVEELRRMIKPAAITIILLFIACISMGIIFHLTTDYSIATTLFSTAPGGLLNTTLMSYEMNANTAVVSVLQVTRLVVVISLFPTLLNLIISKFILKKEISNEEIEENIEITMEHVLNEEDEEKEITPIPHAKDHKLKKLFITILVGSAFGFIGYISKIPAGTLMFTMIGAAILNIFWSNAYIPAPTKKVAQVFGGALIGTNVTSDIIIEMRFLILPGILMMIGYFIINLSLAYILYKKCKLDPITALFSTTPGGATTISLMADDFGAKASIVSTLQIIRSICVVAFYPFIIQLVYILVNSFN